MSELTIVPHSRGLDDVTRDIRIQTGQFLRAAIEIGRLLFEAKDMVEPGGWGRYVEEELPFSHSWANNYMKLYKEYGSDQTSLFGDSQAFMNLRPTQALELLALPAEVREQFVQTHDVEDMSTRELHKEVQEELKKTQAKLRDAEQDKLFLQQKVASLESTEGAWEAEIRKLKAKVETAGQIQKDTQKKLDDMTAKAQAAEEKARESRKRLQELEKDPEIPESVMAQLQQEAQAEADRKAALDSQKEVNKLTAELKRAEEAWEAAEEKLREIQKRSQLSDPDAAVFKAVFQQVQEDFNRLGGLLTKISARDPELGGKLKTAIGALIEKMRGEM